MNDIKELNKWRDSPCLQIRRFNSIMSVLPDLTQTTFNAVPIEIQASYFVDINKAILKFIWRGKKSSQFNFEGEE